MQSPQKYAYHFPLRRLLCVAWFDEEEQLLNVVLSHCTETPEGAKVLPLSKWPYLQHALYMVGHTPFDSFILWYSSLMAGRMLHMTAGAKTTHEYPMPGFDIETALKNF